MEVSASRRFGSVYSSNWASTGREASGLPYWLASDGHRTRHGTFESHEIASGAFAPESR